ncbi:MAG: 3-keto-steroid reductase [Alyxoria varia]|nr:MAG: 3-keto-steroid reductase [Alyxoria varia]
MPEDETPVLRILVTGANSGLGFAICCRLIDEFLHTRPPPNTLALVITTRDERKSADTEQRLLDHLKRTCKRTGASTYSGQRAMDMDRIKIDREILDLTSLVSVKELSNRLLESRSHMNAILLNAGIGGWVAIDWWHAIYKVITDLPQAVTYPPFKIAARGRTTRRQLKIIGSTGKPTKEEPPLGEVFCANVLGHYMLAHYLIPLFIESRQRGRIIWISSLEAYAAEFSMRDWQGLASDSPYEASKRLTDVLALTSKSPATSPYTKQYFDGQRQNTRGASHNKDSTNEDDQLSFPTMHLCQPGVCATSIFPLPFLLQVAMVVAMYLARWMGSIWHPCDPYKGACAPVWLALASQQTIDHLEMDGGPGKWGSATDVFGHERVERTEVEGWGWSGRVGEMRGPSRARKRGAKNLTREQREQFDVLGRDCWAQMEGIRQDWETRLEEVNA